MALVGVELEMLVNEQNALTTRPLHVQFLLSFVRIAIQWEFHDVDDEI